MTLQIELPPPDSAWLDAQAKHHGVEPAEIIRKLVHEQAAVARGASADPTLALFAQCEQEVAGTTSEQITDETPLWDEFEKGIKATRQAQGMRRL